MEQKKKLIIVAVLCTLLAIGFVSIIRLVYYENESESRSFSLPSSLPSFTEPPSIAPSSFISDIGAIGGGNGDGEEVGFHEIPKDLVSGPDIAASESGHPSVVLLPSVVPSSTTQPMEGHHDHDADSLMPTDTVYETSPPSHDFVPPPSFQVSFLPTMPPSTTTLTTKGPHIGSDQISAAAVSSSSSNPSIAPSRSIQKGLILSTSITDNGSEFHDPASPQSRALAWLIDSDVDDNGLHRMYEDWRLIQRYTLASLYYATYEVPSLYTEHIFGDKNNNNDDSHSHTNRISPPLPPAWARSDGWLSGNNECDWYGIECDNGKRVSGIQLGYNNLTGRVNGEISLLRESLRYLDVSDNVIANSFEELDFLGTLTSLSGTWIEEYGIPTVLGNLTNLVNLDISFTLFHGPIRGEEVFSKLGCLRYLEMGGNAYDSTIPEGIVKLPNLEYLYVEFSFVRGDFLSWLGRMRNIREVWVDWNDISGSIPGSLSKTLASLSVSHNAISGTIPSSIGELSDMEQLWLNGNALTGTVPSEIGKLTSLRVLQLEGNEELIGTIPESLCFNRDYLGGTLDTFVSDCLLHCPCCTCCGYGCLVSF